MNKKNLINYYQSKIQNMIHIIHEYQNNIFNNLIHKINDFLTKIMKIKTTYNRNQEKNKYYKKYHKKTCNQT